MLLLVGCRGGGEIALVPLAFQEIDPPTAMPSPLALDEAWWWQADDGQVCIAAQRVVGIPFGPVKQFDFQLLLTLERPPQNKARNYLVRRREMSGRMRAGPFESRFSARAGIVALYRRPGEQYDASLRLLMGRITRPLLGGWSQPTPWVLCGTLTCVPDKEGRGRKIAAELAEAAVGEEETPTSMPSAE